MKTHLRVLLVFLFTVLFSGCHPVARNPYPQVDLDNETWMREVATAPASWSRGADRWFTLGEPNVTELNNEHAQYNVAMSTMKVTVPDFANVKIEGDFQVQLFGSYEHNSVFLYGPNENVRAINVEVRGDTLCLSQSKKLPTMSRAIVRIGVVDLHNLIVLRGQSLVEGRQLRSTGLFINAQGSGNIYLAGSLVVNSVKQFGCGAINIFGAHSAVLDITSQCGCVNISGDVALRTITHHGASEINVIGANGGMAEIYADGEGKVGLLGSVNISKIYTHDRARVYAYPISSTTTYAYLFDASRVGLAGSVTNLSIDASGGSRFMGRNLTAFDVSARAHDAAHINVGGTDRVFASATENASIYYFGSSSILTQFISGNGKVLPMWSTPSEAQHRVQKTVHRRTFKDEGAGGARTYRINVSPQKFRD